MDKIDDTERRKGELEALLFASSRPLSTRVLARCLELSEEQTLHLLGGFASEATAPPCVKQSRADFSLSVSQRIGSSLR
jgi:chromosome segregation and condensation protein ScpB